MKKIIHSFYRFSGYILCFFHSILFKIQIKLNPIEQKSILFVAHPDDDVLFFHSFIKKEKPYVVLLTTGFSLVRIKEFKKAMKHYGVRYNYYSLKTRDTREEKLSSIIKKELNNGSFTTCCSHSLSGEYGHVMHRRVGKAVAQNAKCRLLTTVSEQEIGEEKYRLSQKEIDEKTRIFNTIYSSQKFVLEEYDEWVSHEKLTEVQYE